MGMQITHNKKGYKAISSISGEKYHDKDYLTEDELKALMIEIAMYEFFERVIRIDKDFLHKHRVNGEMHFNEDRAGGLQWMIDNPEGIEDEAHAILKRLNIEFELKP